MLSRIAIKTDPRIGETHTAYFANRKLAAVGCKKSFYNKYARLDLFSLLRPDWPIKRLAYAVYRSMYRTVMYRNH